MRHKEENVKSLYIRSTMLAAAGAALLAGCATRGSQDAVATPTPGSMDAMYGTPTPVPPLPTPVPTKVPNSYIVQKGDSLWKISSQPQIMGDNFRWPLLFKANRDQIIDPDIIEPAQDLTWKDNYSLQDVEDAVGKAKETPPYVPHAKPRKQLPLKY
jgi:hypothetical protein